MPKPKGDNAETDIVIEDPKPDARFDALRGEPAAGAGEHGFFTTGDDVRLFYEAWVPNGAKKIIVCLHGMTAHGRHFAILADALRGHGVGVVALDCRSHGLSQGRRGDWPPYSRIIADTRQFFAFTARRYPGARLYLLGKSMGGAIAAHTAAAHPRGLRGLILFAPAFRPTYKLPLDQIPLLPYYALLAVAAPGARAVKAHGNERRNMRNPLSVDYAQNDPLLLRKVCMRFLRRVRDMVNDAREQTPAAVNAPTIIFVGGRDKSADPRGTREFFDKLAAKDKTFEFYDDAPHSLMTDPEVGPGLLSKLSDWLREH